MAVINCNVLSLTPFHSVVRAHSLISTSDNNTRPLHHSLYFPSVKRRSPSSVSHRLHTIRSLFSVLLIRNHATDLDAATAPTRFDGKLPGGPALLPEPCGLLRLKDEEAGAEGYEADEGDIARAVGGMKMY